MGRIILDITAFRRLFHTILDITSLVDTVCKASNRSCMDNFITLDSFITLDNWSRLDTDMDSNLRTLATMDITACMMKDIKAFMDMATD